jgi:NADPH:quinone reductase-like Zn-dependent oxidoreductase
MKAFVVEKYGKSGLHAAHVPGPTVGPRDVLVRVSAASINPLDKMVRNGEFKLLLKYKTPFVLGHDVAGVVTPVGADVRDYKVGDEVYSRPRDLRIGAFAEYIAIDHADIALKPNSLTMEESAAVPLVALAAWQALVDLAQVKPGQKVLVHAGAGGLGSTVVQLAKHLGATSPQLRTATTRRRCAASAQTKSSTIRRQTSPSRSPTTTSCSTPLVATTSRSR